MTGRFNGPFVEILVSAIIGASWLLGGTTVAINELLCLKNAGAQIAIDFS